MSITKDTRPQCTYVRAWIGQCVKPSFSSFSLPAPRCAEHAHRKCSVCGNQSTHECPETMGALICGAELCDNCTHVSNDMRAWHSSKAGTPQPFSQVAGRPQSAAEDRLNDFRRMPGVDVLVDRSGHAHKRLGAQCLCGVDMSIDKQSYSDHLQEVADRLRVEAQQRLEATPVQRGTHKAVQLATRRIAPKSRKH